MVFFFRPPNPLLPSMVSISKCFAQNNSTLLGKLKCAFDHTILKFSVCLDWGAFSFQHGQFGSSFEESLDYFQHTVMLCPQSSFTSPAVWAIAVKHMFASFLQQLANHIDRNQVFQMLQSLSSTENQPDDLYMFSLALRGQLRRSTYKFFPGWTDRIERNILNWLQETPSSLIHVVSFSWPFDSSTFQLLLLFHYNYQPLHQCESR